MDKSNKRLIENLVSRPALLTKHIKILLQDLDIPFEDANKIETLLKWCSINEFNVEIVTETDNSCVIEFATKFRHDSVITLFKENELYHVITNRSKFFESVPCDKKRSKLSLDEVLDNARPIKWKRGLYKNGFSKILMSLKASLLAFKRSL